MTIRALLFDKDGTLLDYHRTWTPLNREVALYAARGDGARAERLLEIAGLDRLTGRVKPGTVLAGGTNLEIAAAFAEDLGADTPADLAEAVEEIFLRGSARSSVLVEGLHDALAELLAAGYVLGIATNDTVAGITTSLARHNVLDLFTFTAGADSGHGGKPEPGMVHAFCEAVGHPPGDVCVVGDALHDFEMARRAGAGLTVAVLTGTGQRADLEPLADVVIESVAGLMDCPALSRSIA